MTFFDKPRWYGVPVFTKRNVLRYGRSFLILLVLSIVVGVATSYSLTNDERTQFEWFIFVAVNFFSFTIFVSALVASMFFWFRGMVNFVCMLRFRTDAARAWSLQRFVVPFYGMRTKDLTEEGLRYRRLALEGYGGFVGTILLALVFVFFSKLTGVEW